jgi:hypothetical protein
MSLSVSSFPEAPPKLARHPKWHETISLKNNGRFLGTLLSKRPMPCLNLKGIGHFAKAHVKGNIIHHRVNVPLSRFKHPSPHSRSSIRASSIVIDIIPIPNNDECFYTSSDVDGSSLDPSIDLFPSPPICPPALSTSSTVKVRPQAHEKGVQHPAREQEEVASVVYDSEPHNSQASDSESTITPPIPPSQTTQPLAPPSTVGRHRWHSASAGAKAASATETAPPTRPRHKSETEIGLRRPTTSSPDDASASEGKGRGKDPKQRRARSSASSKSAGTIQAAEFPAVPSPPLPSVHMLSMRSGSRPSAHHHLLPGGGRPSGRPSTAPQLQSFPPRTSALVPKSPSVLQVPYLRPKMTGDSASTRSRSRSWSRSRSHSPSLAASLSEDVPPLPPLPSSANTFGVPVSGSQDEEQQQKRRRRTAPESVSTASW